MLNISGAQQPKTVWFGCFLLFVYTASTSSKWRILVSIYSEYFKRGVVKTLHSSESVQQHWGVTYTSSKYPLAGGWRYVEVCNRVRGWTGVSSTKWADIHSLGFPHCSTLPAKQQKNKKTHHISLLGSFITIYSSFIIIIGSPILIGRHSKTGDSGFQKRIDIFISTLQKTH